jgi:hypothetical protein
MQARTARFEGATEPADVLKWKQTGYLVGDRFISDNVRVDVGKLTPEEYALRYARVFLIEEGMERFARVEIGRVFEDGPLIFGSLAFPLGPEDEVTRAFEDQALSIGHIKGVVPALHAAFSMETFQREEAERRRQEAERIRREEEARRQLEERRQRLIEQLGDGAGRREMAQVDFREAATAALAVGGAEYLDHRKGRGRAREMVVRFRMEGERFECVCHQDTLQIIDAGICLIDHSTDERGDTYFTLESLPGVVRQALNGGRLHRFRHA